MKLDLGKQHQRASDRQEVGQMVKDVLQLYFQSAQLLNSGHCGLIRSM